MKNETVNGKKEMEILPVL